MIRVPLPLDFTNATLRAIWTYWTTVPEAQWKAEWDEAAREVREAVNRRRWLE